jgi:ferredoxin
MEQWVEFNRKFSEVWPVIVSQKEPMPNADERDGEPDKMNKYFSEKPGEGG